jgi:protein-tyrosine-phosphatase
MGKIKNVLFLCSGNTARSPAAEYIAKWLKATKYKEELKDVQFDSAGLYSYYKTPREFTVKYLESKNIDFSDFSGKQINAELVNKQDLILGFEAKWHIRKLKRRFKNIEDLDKKTYLLLDFTEEKENLEIPDPIESDQDGYYKILERIEYGVIKSIEKIIKINETSN